MLEQIVCYYLMQEVYDRQKELILLGERVVLATLGFDLNVHHPYKPLIETIKKFKITHNALTQVAWNFVNDGYANATFVLLSNTSTRFMSLSHPKKAVHCTGSVLHFACNSSLITLQQVHFFWLVSFSK